MDEHLDGRDYYLELQAARKKHITVAAKFDGLDQEKKAESLASQGLELGQLLHTLDYAIEIADGDISDAQMLLAVESVGFELRDV